MGNAYEKEGPGMKITIVEGSEYCPNFTVIHAEHVVGKCPKCAFGNLICDGAIILCNKCTYIVEDQTETYDLSDPISNT